MHAVAVNLKTETPCPIVQRWTAVAASMRCLLVTVDSIILDHLFYNHKDNTNINTNTGSVVVVLSFY